MRELQNIAEAVALRTAQSPALPLSAEESLTSLLKHPSLPPSVLRYLESSNLKRTEHGFVLEVPSQFYLIPLRKFENQLKEILRCESFQIEVNRVALIPSERPPAPTGSAPAPEFRPKPVPLPPNAARALPVIKVSDESLMELEKNRRLPAPIMNLSPNFQTPFELAKRWAESVNKGGNQILWVYGKSGTGKTHVLKHLHEWVSLKKRIVHVDAMTFFHEWRRALEAKDTMGFVRKYRKEPDLLILENIDFLENKGKTQEEILITVNWLMDKGANIVVSSSRSPASLREVMDPSLFSRLFGGMIIELPTPDRGFKESLWKQLMEQHGLKDWNVDVVVLERIFNIPVDTARGVHTLLVNAIANLSLKGMLTLKEAAELEARFTPHEGPRMGPQSSPADFMDKISRLCGVGMSAIQGNGRRSEISLARKFVCLALCRFLGMTNSSIAVYVNKDASTVSKALAAVEEEILADRHVSGQWAYICQQMGVSSTYERNPR